VIPRSLIAADRRHHTCLRDAREHYIWGKFNFRGKKSPRLHPAPLTSVRWPVSESRRTRDAQAAASGVP